MTRQEKGAWGMVFWWSTLLLLLMIDCRCCFCHARGPVHSTPPTKCQCNGKGYTINPNTSAWFSAPDSGNLKLAYHSEDDGTITFLLQPDEEEAREPCKDTWPTFKAKENRKEFEIIFSYSKETKTTHVHGEEVHPWSYTGYKLKGVELRTSGVSVWRCSSLDSHNDHATRSDSNTIAGTPICPITPSDIDNHNRDLIMIAVGVGVGVVVVVVFLCGLAHYCKKTRSAGHRVDPSHVNPSVETVKVATGAVAAPKPGEEHIYEEWNESYRHKDEQRGSTHSDVNSIYQDYQPKGHQRGSTHSDVNSIYQPFDG